MIRYTDTPPTVEGEFGIYFIKIYGQYQSYGAAPPLEGWVIQSREGASPCGWITRLSGRITIAARLMDRELLAELRAFLPALGGNVVEAELPLLQGLGMAQDGRRAADGTFTSSAILRYDGHRPLRPLATGTSILPAPSLGAVFSLLCRADTRFAAETDYAGWLTDLSHKRRHHLGETYILTVNNRMISTVSRLFETETDSLLGLVATEPEWQGRGYGGMLVHQVAQTLAEQGKTAWVLAGEEKRIPFYERLGFAVTGAWGEWRNNK